MPRIWNGGFGTIRNWEFGTVRNYRDSLLQIMTMTVHPLALDDRQYSTTRDLMTLWP